MHIPEIATGSDALPVSMRALSMWRPWADWVVLGWKTIETRKHRRFRRLGERPTLLAIHAAARWDGDAIYAARPWLTDEQIHFTETILRQRPVGGHVIGTVTVLSFGELGADDEPEALIECQSVTRYGLRLAHPTPLATPLRVRGRQGLFTVEIPGVSRPHAGKSTTAEAVFRSPCAPARRGSA